MSITTEKHTNNTLIGSGEVYLDLLDAQDGTTGERYLGDAVSANLSVTTERAQVFSGTGPIAKKLVDQVRSLSRTFTITLRDISADNLALFVGAPEPATVADAAIEVENEPLTVRKGRWYQLGVSDDKPTGVGAVSAVAADTTVAKKTGNTIYVAGTDYTLDAKRGRLYIEPGGAIADGAELKVTYTPVAASRRQVRTGELSEVRAAMRYIEDSAAGEGRNYYAVLCSVGASGELGLMSRDTEQQIQLTCEILEPEDGRPALVIDGEAA